MHNCNVDLKKLRRHSTSSLSNALLIKLVGWLTIEIPVDSNLCHACFELLNSNEDERLLGHTMLCVTCGRSVRLLQQHVLERDHSMLQNLPLSHPAFNQVTNYACHRCWMRHERQYQQDLNRALSEPVPAAPESTSVPVPLEPALSPVPAAPESTSVPVPPELTSEPGPASAVPEPKINLPNYKRAANTSARCVFSNCIFPTMGSYYGEHIRMNSVYEVEVYPELEGIKQFGETRPKLLRGRIKSRHINSRMYYVYIVYESESTNNPLEGTLAYNCSCIVGNRTVGCCCHVMTVVWYLGWARHQDDLSPPAGFLDNILVRLTE